MDYQLEYVCRLCLLTKNIMEPLYDNNDQELLNKIYSCTSVDVNDSYYEGSPKYICIDCISNVDISYKLREICIRSNEILIEKMKEIDIDPEAKEEEEIELNYDYIEDQTSGHEVIEEKYEQLEAHFIDEDVNVENKDVENAIIENLSQMIKYKKSLKNIVVDMPDYISGNEKKFTVATLVETEHLKETDKESNGPESIEAKNESDDSIEEKENDESKTMETKMKMKKVFKNTVIEVPDENGGVRYAIQTVQSFEPVPRKITSKKYKRQNVKKLSECPTCGKLVKFLKSHLETHSEERKYKCTICDKSYRFPATFNAHMKKHKGIKPYKCDECSKAYTLKFQLDYHKMRHTGVRNFLCDLCDKTYLTIGALNIHMRRHKQDLRFECEICQKRFVTNVQLKNHKGTHGAQYRHLKCSFCPKSFSRKDYLDKHVNKHKVDQIEVIAEEEHNDQDEIEDGEVMTVEYIIEDIDYNLEAI